MKAILLFFLLISSAYAQIDADADEATRALHKRLNDISLSFSGDQKILMGQHNAFIEGRGWRVDATKLGEPLKSDMYDATGMHPAVFGFDLLEVSDFSRAIFIDRAREVQKRNGVVTLSWHMKSLVDDGVGDNSSWDVTTKVVPQILPGGPLHGKLIEKLDILVTFLREIQDVPVVFRPWHEHNFSWFWWGTNTCTKEEYVTLWRFTVDYLKSNGIHNLLYAYSPGHLKDDYFDRYPGDNYVDIIGTDFYFKTPELDTYSLGQYPLGQWKRKIVSFLKEADKRNKIPVIAETGQEGISYDKFWTDYFAWPLMRKGMEQFTAPGDMPKRGVAWVMLWRNDSKSATHFFGPYVGHALNSNFMEVLRRNIFIGLE